MSNIKNIIFDFGAVLYDIDFLKMTCAFEKIGIPNFNQQYAQSQASELFCLLEKGQMDAQDFFCEIHKQSNKNITIQQVEDAWNAILLDYRKESIQWLLSNQSKYRYFLLSNTNVIHYQYFSKQFSEQFSGNSLESLFEKAFYSFEIGMRKPDSEIFRFVISEAKLNPQETLFVDDTSIHIETALSLGFQCHHLLPNERIETLGKF
jgi:putative hydrolase of the HAD superfamily